MNPNVECVSPETALRDAAQKMEAYDIGFLPVGAVTDRDITIWGSRGRDMTRISLPAALL